MLKCPRLCDAAGLGHSGGLFLDLNELLTIPPYGLTSRDKSALLTERLANLTTHHYERCKDYRAMLDVVGFDSSSIDRLDSIPFLPVRLFKELDLLSVDRNDVVKVMTSSGTTGQAVSKVYLDRATASSQQKVLVKIVSSFTGSARMPMLIVDSPAVLHNRSMFSARGAGILGFSIFGSDKVYALKEDMSLDVPTVAEFLERHQGETILIFGFTFMVWQYLYRLMLQRKSETGETFDLSNAVLIHGGGWKKMISEAVSPQEFCERLASLCGLSRVHDYYGMVEQTGCIYMQCEHGYLHASVFSDVIMRNPRDFSVCGVGERGIIQVLSTIPQSYPGHSLLTEDEGVLEGEDDCRCGRKGKYFRVIGRLENAELRGCSDTYATVS